MLGLQVLNKSRANQNCTNWKQNSHLKKSVFPGVRGLTTSSDIVYEYTTSGPVEYIYLLFILNTYISMQCTYISKQYTYLHLMQ